MISKEYRKKIFGWNSTKSLTLIIILVCIHIIFAYGTFGVVDVNLTLLFWLSVFMIYSLVNDVFMRMKNSKIEKLENEIENLKK